MWTLVGVLARRVWNSGELLNSPLHPCGNELHFGSQFIGFGDSDGCPIALEPLHEIRIEKGPLFQSFPCEDLVRARCDASDRETAGLIGFGEFVKTDAATILIGNEYRSNPGDWVVFVVHDNAFNSARFPTEHDV